MLRLRRGRIGVQQLKALGWVWWIGKRISDSVAITENWIVDDIGERRVLADDKAVLLLLKEGSRSLQSGHPAETTKVTELLSELGRRLADRLAPPG